MLLRGGLSLLVCALSLVTTNVMGIEFHSRLINGTVVDPGTFNEVIKIRADGAGCTATIVGPRVIITAAHCARTGATAEFTYNGSTYQAKMTRSGLYPAQDHDIAVGITTSEIVGAKPYSVVGKTDVAAKGLRLTLLGYGCTQVGGSDTPDGKLRKGETQIVSFTTYDMESRMSGGAALCFGDSGGPAFYTEGGTNILLGINSKGNIQDTNYNTRADLAVSQTFLKTFATDSSVEICGINKVCGIGPGPTAPTCTLASNPSSVQLGGSVNISMGTSGQVTGATLDGVAVTFPSFSKTVTPAAVGTFTAFGTVTGPGGSGSCQTSYTVVNNPGPIAPTCTISVAPATIKLGQTVVATIQTQGQVNSASIDSTPVTYPSGSISIRPTLVGWYSATGLANGPGGSGNCRASYNVEGDDPPPATGNFTVVPLHCGINNIFETPVREVCTAAVSFSGALRDMAVKEVLIVGFSDGSEELLPIVYRKALPKAPTDVQNKEDLALYANGLKKEGSALKLDIRKATLSTIPGQEAPAMLEGRSSNGHYFLIDKFKKPGARELKMARSLSN